MMNGNGFHSIDVINYLAIIALEEAGDFSPTQNQIDRMEAFLFNAINYNIRRYTQLIPIEVQAPLA